MKKLNTLFLIMVVSTIFLGKGVVGACDSTNVDLTLIGNEIPVSTATGTQSLPEVAYDNINNRYIVVWRDNGGTGSESINAQLINSTGSLISSKALITTENSERAAVAFGSTSGKYLVVYTASFDSLYGQFLDRDGNLSGAAFEINSTGGMFSMISSISYNSHNNTFLVVYQIYANSSHDIYGIRIDGSTGALIGGEIAIATSSDDENAPSTAYNNDANQWLVTWSGVGGNIAQIINGSTGALIGGQRNLSSSYGFGEVVYDKNLKTYFILSFPNLKGMLLDPTNLNVLACDIPINVDAVSCQAVDAGIAYNPTRKQYFMVWHRNADPQASCIPCPGCPEPELDVYGQRFKVTYPVHPFVFSTISDPQKVGVPFNVTITAVPSTFDGQVSLTSNLGSVSPTSVNIVDGQTTVSVRLYNPGSTRLNCSGSGKYGNSNYFDVTGATACTGKIFGKIIDARGDIVYQAEVKLHEPGGLVVAEDQTDANGKFSFMGIACGTYEVSVIKDGHSKTVSNISVSSTLPQILDDIRLQLNSGTRGTPVILVPGMMGSTYDSTQVFPVLTAIPGLHNLSIWDYDDKAGWENLELYLHDMGFKVFKCPWDWRMTCEEAYKEYLIKRINEALDHSTTGKVDIIAHSMGGLVVRAYIQSSDYKDRGDIDKLAMVGTPHLGSCNPYYIWEGGDPKTIDDITDSGWKSIINAYSRTINKLLETYDDHYYSSESDKMPHKEMRAFVRDKVPSLRQLMYTEDFLKDKSGLRAVTTDGNENEWLKGLNQGNSDYVKPSDRMSAKNDGKVQVRLFVGTKDPDDYSTVAYVTTQDQDNPDYKNDLYEDGIPKKPMKKNVTMWDGDGTVPYDSATWPLIDGWADIETPTLKGDHISLVKTYRDQITAFLTGEVSASRATEKSSKAKDAQVTPSSELSFSVTGTVRLMITNPEGQQTGMEPYTGNPVEQIPSSRSVFSSEGGGVSVENPAQGTYAVTFFGEAARDFRLNIGFSDGEITEIKQFQGFCPDAARTLTVLVALSDTPRITVTLQAKTPTGLKAEPYTSGGPEYTRLTWSTTGEADITGYNVYSVAEQEPYFARVATLSAGTTSYDSTDQWSSSSSTKVMTYAVTAVKSGDAESFFSVLARNNDRDHDWITDEKEASLGTDPNKSDTDEDGLNDGEELAYGTNPLVKDTDGDTFSDYDEIQAGSDPLDPNSIPSVIPTITSFTPTSGSMGTTVIITGTNFAGTEVKFGGRNAARFTVDSVTQITAVVGTGSTGNVTVTTDGGTATSASTFIYTSAATLATGNSSSYNNTVTKVEMYNGTSWVTIFSGTAQLDMVTGGTFPGISNLNLPAGTYSQIRVTFNNAFPVSGMLNYSGTGYYTTGTTFGGQTNLASTPTTVARSKAAFTFYNPAWGTHNADVTQAYAITPITVGPTTDYQPTLRFTISSTLLLKGIAGNFSSYFFSLDAPTGSLVEP